MSLFPLARTRARAQRVAAIDGPDGSIPSRRAWSTGSVQVTNADTALRHSAVWAATRLRSDLVSTLPLDCYREFKPTADNPEMVGSQGTLNVEVATPPVLVEPGGPDWDLVDWMWASGADLTLTGNSIGLITERNGLDLPARIELQHPSCVTVIQRKGEAEPRYRINGTEYRRRDVWHEKSYPVSGLAVGLSPLMYAAWSIGEGLSAQRFALDWFAGGGVPKSRLKHTERRVPPREAAIVKDQFRASVADGDLFVHGKDWEFDMMSAQQLGLEWLEARRFGLSDIARFFGVPADVIDAAVAAGGSITYANITQRNLQLLIHNLGPEIRRREKNLSKLLPRPRYVKLNSDALLRMDPEARQRVISDKLKMKQLTPTEARALDNLPPFTPEQVAEISAVYGTPRTSPTGAEASLWHDPDHWRMVSPLSAAPLIGAGEGRIGA